MTTSKITTDPYSGLQFVELSHEWDQRAPSYPGQTDVRMVRGVKHSQHGVLAWRITTSLHTGTHMIAPIHLIQRGADLAAVDPIRFFGNGIVLDVPKTNWEVITAADLEKAGKNVKEGDIIAIVTGWHHKYSDGLEYYGEAPGLSKDAAEWLVSKKPKMVFVDTPHFDHPLATSMAPHRGGPHMKRLVDSYSKATGLDWKKEHGEWNVAHKIVLGAGIPTVLQIGGDVDVVKGKRVTLAATPWKFEHGEASQVRVVAMFDPTGNCRIEQGK